MEGQPGWLRAPPDVYVDHQIEFFLCHFVKLSVARYVGVVDEDFHPVLCLNAVSDSATNNAWIAAVRLNGDGLSAEFSDCRNDRVSVILLRLLISDGEINRRLRKCEGNRISQSSASSCNRGSLSYQTSLWA